MPSAKGMQIKEFFLKWCSFSDTCVRQRAKACLFVSGHFLNTVRKAASAHHKPALPTHPIPICSAAVPAKDWSGPFECYEKTGAARIQRTTPVFFILKAVKGHSSMDVEMASMTLIYRDSSCISSRCRRDRVRFFPQLFLLSPAAPVVEVRFDRPTVLRAARPAAFPSCLAGCWP